MPETASGAARLSPDPIDVAVGARVRTRRKQLRISQTELADALGLTFQQVQKYERGTNRMSASMLVRTARKLKTTVSELVGEEEAAPGHLLADMLVTGAPELLQSFAQIRSPTVRRSLVDLVRKLGAEERDA